MPPFDFPRKAEPWPLWLDGSLPLSIAYIQAANLRPYGRNARLHSRKRVRQIANRVRTFGFTNPVLIDSQNMILAGHARVEAATLPTMANVPCVLAETMTPAAIIGWLRGAVMSTFQEMGSSMSAELVYRLANAFFGLDRAELDIIGRFLS